MGDEVGVELLEPCTYTRVCIDMYVRMFLCEENIGVRTVRCLWVYVNEREKWQSKTKKQNEKLLETATSKRVCVATERHQVVVSSKGESTRAI